MSDIDLDAIRADIEMAVRSPEMARHVALDHGPELVAEVEHLRKITDIIDPDSVYREQRDQAWAERDAANAEVERLRAIVAGVRAELTNITDDESYDRIAAVPGLLR